MRGFLAGAVLGGLAMLGASGVMLLWAQGPPAAPPGAAVPEWVIRYATSQEQARRACDVALAQEQDKAEKLQKDLADAKAALAKAATPEKK